MNPPTCDVAGCDEASFFPERWDYTRDRKATRLCADHADEFWTLTERHDHDGRTTVNSLPGLSRRDEWRRGWKSAHAKVMRQPDAMGQIYFVRVNGLIKVGWTSDLASRMRAYGPTAELLAHYPASRADERNLHRNLTPIRAKGREWYHDHPLIEDMVADVIKRHGEPRFTAIQWTEPKDLQVRVRGYRGQVR